MFKTISKHGQEIFMRRYTISNSWTYHLLFVSFHLGMAQTWSKMRCQWTHVMLVSNHIKPRKPPFRFRAHRTCSTGTWGFRNVIQTFSRQERCVASNCPDNASATDQTKQKVPMDPEIFKKIVDLGKKYNIYII